MELLPIYQTEAENAHFAASPDCWETVLACVDFYGRIGYVPPWICYIVRRDDQLVAGIGFKGQPVNNTVEIAYGTFPAYQRQGIAAEGCRMLVELALQTDPDLRVTARTLPQESYSTKTLKKNGFRCLGLIWDNEDDDVWEWEYVKSATIQ